MARGDRRSKKGKVWRGTYGKTRPRKGNKKKTTAESRDGQASNSDS